MYETKAGSFPNKDHLPRLNIKLMIKLNWGMAHDKVLHIHYSSWQWKRYAV